MSNRCLYCAFCGIPMEKVSIFYRSRRVLDLMGVQTRADCMVPVCQICEQELSNEEMSQRLRFALTGKIK